MLRYIKKSIFVTFCILAFVNCRGQVNNKNFDSFLSKFTDFNFPVNPTEFIVNREARLQTIAISKKDYDEFLRVGNDTVWLFKNFFEYSYGGKHKLSNYWLVFYSRHFIPDDVNLQKGEFVLATFSFDGNMISSVPVAGGYGDTLTFSSLINGTKDIVVNYTLYQSNKEDKYSKHYVVDDNGILSIKDGN